MKIIVSRYNENIEWTFPYQNVIIYNKGEPLGLHNEYPLKNVGREGHTFYTYIVDHYDKLDDYTIFLQGNPFDHLPNILEILNNYKYDKPILDFQLLSRYHVKCNITGCKFHPNLPLKNVYEYLYGSKIDNLPFTFGTGGQFIVSKEKILKNPKSFYEKIIKLLDYDINPIEGFVIERFHPLFFN